MDDMIKIHCINILNLKTKKNIKKEKVAEYFQLEPLVVVRGAEMSLMK